MEIEMDADDLMDTIKTVESVNQTEALFELKSDRWIIKSQSPSTVLGTAIRVHERNMVSYDRRETEEVALKLKPIKKFISSDTENLQLWLDGSRLHIKDNTGAHAVLETIDPRSVEGAMSKTLDLEHPVKFRLDESMLVDFASRIDDIIGTQGMFIEADERGLWLYGSGDGYKSMDSFISWDDDRVSDIDIEWSRGPDTDKGYDKTEKEIVTTLLDADFMQNVYSPGSDIEPVIAMGNHYPMQLIFDLSEGESGHAISYMIAPRIPESEDSREVVPEDVKEVR